MPRDAYPRLTKLYSIAHLPANPDEFLRESDESEIAKSVWEFYTQDDKEGIKPLEYKVTATGQEYSIRSNLGIYDDGRFPDVKTTKKDRRYFSEYEDSILDMVGLDREQHWNGDIADVRYINDEVHVGKTDYYSTAPIVRMLCAEINHQDSNPLREYILSDINHFEDPIRPIPATSGGIMIANKGDDEWVLLIGKRSEETHINSGMFSIFPNGKSEYSDFNAGFEKTAKREFREEIFDDQTNGDVFYDKHIETKKVVSGWNLRSGGFTVGNVLIMNSQLSYDVLDELSNYNDEVDDIIEIPITDISMIAEKANLENMSGAAVATVWETLRKINQSDRFPDMTYEIDRK